MAAPMPTAPTGKYYTDQTGHFPCTSSSDNNYVLIAYLTIATAFWQNHFQTAKLTVYWRHTSESLSDYAVPALPAPL
jgi:hypothetical protein